MAAVGALVGFAAGAALVGAGVVWAMRNMFVAKWDAKGGFEDVCRRLEQAMAESDGWYSRLPVWDFYRSQTQNGFRFDNVRNLRIYIVCKSPYANRW